MLGSDFMMTAAPPDHLRRVAVQQYARRGWSVFPLTPGKLEQAREHLAAGTTMYREMRMTYGLKMADQ